MTPTKSAPHDSQKPNSMQDKNNQVIDIYTKKPLNDLQKHLKSHI